jgi:hypothetical protein
MKATNLCRVNHRFFSQVYHIILGIANWKETLKHWKQNNKHIPIRPIHEHTVTQHLKDIDTYTTHIQLRLRVLACIHDVYNKHTFTHSRYTQMQRHTHILTLTHTKTTHTHAHTSNNTHTTWTDRHPHRGFDEGCVKSKGWEGTVSNRPVGPRPSALSFNFRSWSETEAA